MEGFNHKDYFYIALIPQITGSWSFTSYTDKDGRTVRAISGIDPLSKIPRNFEIRFSARERIFRGRKNQTVNVVYNEDYDNIKKIPLYDYIVGYPNCFGSPNFSQDNPVILIKEIDEQRDAGLALDRMKRRNDAVNKAFALKDEALDEMAYLIGVFTDQPEVKQRRVAEFADQSPEEFHKLYESPQKEYRALLKKALQMKKLTKVGDAFFWEKEALGGSEDQAVSYLMANPEKYKALQSVVKKLK